MKITEATFRKFAKLIAAIAGIELAENRERMLVNRISARLVALNLKSFDEYYELLSCDNQQAERQVLIDSVTTHFTSFFRDEGQFEHVRTELVKLFAGGQRKIRIWSTACSSGEEPYSLAIAALEAAVEAGVATHDIRILATDISRRVLKEAYEGWYPVSTLKKLTTSQRTYFEPTSRVCEITGEQMVRVSKQLRDMVIFRRVNLIEHPLQVPSEIDIIFCRNVLLYFNIETQRIILSQVTEKLKERGLIYVGASEQIRAYLPQMECVRACVFRVPESSRLLPSQLHAPSSWMQSLNPTCQ